MCHASYPIIDSTLLCPFGVWNRQVTGCQENDCRRRGNITERGALYQGIMANRRGRIVSKRIKKGAINYPAVEFVRRILHYHTSHSFDWYGQRKAPLCLQLRMNCTAVLCGLERSNRCYRHYRHLMLHYPRQLSLYAYVCLVE